MAEMKIKICGMREPENIKAVCKLGPDFLGLIFYPKSKRFVSDKEAGKINSVIPENIQKVGVFVNELLPDIIRKINLFGLKLVQLHGNEPSEYCTELKSIGIKVIKSFGVDENFDFSQIAPYAHCCDYILFDTKSSGHGGAGRKFNWDLLSGYESLKPVFLSGGIGPDDAAGIKALNGFSPFALDINSRFEVEPAIKDVTLLKKFITEIRTTKI